MYCRPVEDYRSISAQIKSIPLNMEDVRGVEECDVFDVSIQSFERFELGSGEHISFMKQALLMGEKALAVGETPVGCVLVHEGKILGSGMNDTNRSMNGTRHAEFLAIQEALQNYSRSIFRQADLYVTVEPCVMCASTLRQYNIRRVFFGCSNERFGGTGGVLSLHTDSGIDPPYPVYGGLFRNESIMLLRRFYIQENEKAPNPRSKKNRELNTGFHTVV